jgi:hypothetical protein|tara:strand:- start:1 stop:213 length:213 start_codon:yes stop_codon:yes gene_type:complete
MFELQGTIAYNPVPIFQNQKFYFNDTVFFYPFFAKHDFAVFSHRNVLFRRHESYSCGEIPNGEQEISVGT